ncbi:MAG TPA: hypothetical protein VHD61_05500 [Lacunisphaera sp.]|nr:hypothetical protein [Lacunisphaera sp.]
MTDRPGNSSVGATLVASSPESRAGALPPGGARVLWLWVAAGFLLLAAGWTVLFTVAHRAQVQSVPLAGTQGGTRP